MKTIEWRTPNFMVMESDHQTFNRQCRIVTTGNIISNTQTGFHVRAVNTTEYEGKPFVFGHLHNVDLKVFGDLPRRVAEYMWKNGRDKDLILYCFHHYNGQKQITHGYVVTDEDHKFLACLYANNSQKSHSVLRTCLPYICTEESIERWNF